MRPPHDDLRVPATELEGTGGGRGVQYRVAGGGSRAADGSCPGAGPPGGVPLGVVPVLCADGPVKTLAGLSLAPEHRRGHGALYDAVNHGRIGVARLRRSLAGLPLPRAADGRLMLAVDVSSWLRPGAATSPQRLFCHVYGRGKGQAQMIPGWPYSVIAALEPGRTSWTAVLDAVRLGPDDDEAAVTAGQVREVVARLSAAGHCR